MPYSKLVSDELTADDAIYDAIRARADFPESITEDYQRMAEWRRADVIVYDDDPRADTVEADGTRIASCEFGVDIPYRISVEGAIWRETDAMPWHRYPENSLEALVCLAEHAM